MSERFFEDFHVGERFQSAEYTFSEREIIEFASRYDPQPFHIDPVAAKQSPFGGLIASGWHTAAIAMRLRTLSDIEVAGGLIGMGVEEIRWPQPIRPGDTIRLEAEIIEMRPSRSHPDRGIIRVRETALNQRKETVLTMVTTLWTPLRR